MKEIQIPIQGGPLDPGEEPLPTGSIPLWLSERAMLELLRSQGDDVAFGSDRFCELHAAKIAAGGFGPLELLDLLAGGSGSGVLWRARRSSAAQARLGAHVLTNARGLAASIVDDYAWERRLCRSFVQYAVDMLKQGARSYDFQHALKVLLQEQED